MSHTTCLNCGKELIDKFCHGCGQKADTHRITFTNFVSHDLLHGTFHIEKGILFTAKQSLLRPGKAALEYIAGKRKRYYNVFYLILITIGILLFIRHANQIEEAVTDSTYANEASRKIDDIFSKTSKFIIFLFVPFGALNSFMLFRRKKLNLSEHFILSGMMLLGILLINFFSIFVFILNEITHFSGTVLSWMVTAICFLYVAYGYFNAFSPDYSKLGFAYRILLFFAFLFLEVFILLFILVGFVTDWKYGEITIAPFG